MKYNISKLQKGGSVKEKSDPIYTGGWLQPAITSYKYNMEDYDNLAAKKNLNQVPSQFRGKVMEAKVRGAINKGVKNVLLPTAGIPAGIIGGAPMVGAAIASPIATIGGLVGGTLGQIGTDKVIQKVSNNKYSGWGNMISQKTGLPPLLSEFTNPGGWIGGLIGSKIKHTYKLNPWAFKPKVGYMYRGLGKEGYEDAIESGVFRPKVNGKQIKITSKNGLNINLGKKFDKTYYTNKEHFNVLKNYDPSYIAEVPDKIATFRPRYSNKNDWSWLTEKQIPIIEGSIYKKDWLQGYKKVPIELKQRWFPRTEKSFNVQVNKSVANSQENIIKNEYTIDDYMNFTRDAKSELLSRLDNPIVQETMRHNSELATRLGIKLPRMEIDGKIVQLPIEQFRKLSLNNPIYVGSNDLGENILGQYNNLTHQLTYNSRVTNPSLIKNIAIHETGHHGNFGSSRIEMEKARRLLKSERELDALAEKSPALLNVDEHYLRTAGEPYTNTVDLAKDLNISIGEKYPGWVKVKEMLDNYVGDKQFLIDAFKKETPRDYKRVWDALTGKWYVIGGLTTGAVSKSITEK